MLLLKYKNILIWWLSFSAVWGIYRLFALPELTSEVVAKPIIWLGITALFISRGLISKKVIHDFKTNYSAARPFWKVFFLPILFIMFYFLLINFQKMSIPDFSVVTIFLAIVINFSTAIVEEIIYRAILYVWLLQKTGEVKAFIFVQVLFLLGHLPTLIINSSTLSAGLSHAFFILLIGVMHTLIFRFTKSIYASTLSHGIWNSLAYYFL